MEQCHPLEANSILSWSRNSPQFMEPGGSLPSLQQPITGPHFELD
jgi:hypothetical protein